MKEFNGKIITEGIVYGKISIYKKNKNKIRKENTKNYQFEIEKVRAAKRISLKQLHDLYDKAVLKAGKKDAEIFKAHQLLLEDKGYTHRIETVIREEEVNAEYAVNLIGNRLYQHFLNMEDIYLKERANDIKDVSERIIRNMSEQSSVIKKLKEKIILFSENFTPSEIMELDQNKILAIVISSGSEYSHMAILAASLQCPVLIDSGINMEEIEDGMEAVVDCYTGKVYINPNVKIKKITEQKIAEDENKKDILLKLKKTDCIIQNGKKIMLYANINDENEISQALDNGADGIGLFRSEFMYMKTDRYPGEEEQFCIYKNALDKLKGKRLVVRTADIGADKKSLYLNMEKEDNPALGCRGIRFSLCHPDIFKTQIRAVLRASVYGNIALLYPMITSVYEMKRIRKIVCEVKRELSEENILYKDIEEGVMIETPAAVMISDDLAGMADFFSIGTNDLTQYTLAMDRQNSKNREFYDAYHPAVQKMIKIVVENAHKKGKKVGICGELSGDQKMTEIFINVGIDELSMSSSKILPVKNNILKIVRK